MRADHEAGASQLALAAKYSISRAQVHNVVAHKQWVRRDEWQLSAPA